MDRLNKYIFNTCTMVMTISLVNNCIAICFFVGEKHRHIVIVEEEYDEPLLWSSSIGVVVWLACAYSSCCSHSSSPRELSITSVEWSVVSSDVTT